MANFKMVQESFETNYFLPKPGYGYDVTIRSNQWIDEDSKLGKALLKYAGENIQYEGATGSVMENLVKSGEVGSSLTTEQKATLDKLDGIESSASEIDTTVSIGNTFTPIIKDGLFLWCGDSTTEQAGSSGYLFDHITDYFRNAKGTLFNNCFGFANFGGSGYTIKGFYEDALTTTPNLSSANEGVSVWDFYGHKPTGAINLNTSISFRNQYPTKPTTWTICYGINDCILSANIGNMTEDEIVDYISNYLILSVKKIQANNSKDNIILRSPNPITARPFLDAGFPSSTAYSTFGDDLVIDAALVEKWNNALERAYELVANVTQKTKLWNVKDRVFGKINTLAETSDDLILMGDLVHPSEKGYRGLARDFVEVIDLTQNKLTEGIKYKIEQSSDIDYIVSPYALKDESKYNDIFGKVLIQNVGSAYIDLSIDYESFDNFVSSLNSKTLIIQFGENYVQEFTSFTYSNSGGSARLLSISVDTDIYTNFTRGYGYLLTPKSYGKYDNSLLNSLVYDYRVDIRVKGSGGNGYFDMNWNPLYGNRYWLPWTWRNGYLNARLFTVDGTEIDLAGASFGTNGSASGTTARMLKGGFDFSPYSGQEMAFVWDEETPHPILSEV